MNRNIARMLCVIALLGIVGCQTAKLTVASLEGQKITPEQSLVVPEKATYYLYSTKDEHSPVYQIDLKKGDEFGFRLQAKNGIAWAKGVMIQLDEFDDKVNYFWKIDEKKDK